MSSLRDARHPTSPQVIVFRTVLVIVQGLLPHSQRQVRTVRAVWGGWVVGGRSVGDRTHRVRGLDSLECHEALHGIRDFMIISKR